MNSVQIYDQLYSNYDIFILFLRDKQFVFLLVLPTEKQNCTKKKKTIQIYTTIAFMHYIKNKNSCGIDLDIFLIFKFIINVFTEVFLYIQKLY